MLELPFLHSAHHLMLIDICMKFHEDSLRGFQVTERTRFVTDRWTYGQTDARGKTICLLTLRGGDIIPAVSCENKVADQLRSNCTAQFVSDLVENFEDNFVMTRLIFEHLSIIHGFLASKL